MPVDSHREERVKLPKVDLRHELVLNLSLIGCIVSLLMFMPLLLRSTGKW